MYSRKFGAIISFVDGKMVPLRFEDMLNPQTGRMQVRKVNVEGESFEVARSYMIRLTRADFENGAQLAALSSVAKLTPEDFRRRFEYLTGPAEDAGGAK